MHDGTKTIKDMKKVIILFLSIIIIYIIYKAFVAAGNHEMDKSKYLRCTKGLTTLRVAEEMYIVKNHRYADNEHREMLGMYMIPNCKNPKGCEKAVEEYAGTPYRPSTSLCQDFEIISLNNGLDYQITGTSPDRYNCKICVTPKALFPYDYKECKKDMIMTCP